MDNLEKKMLYVGVVLLGLFSILFCAHDVVMYLPIMASNWIYWILYVIFLIFLFKYFVDKSFLKLKYFLFAITIIVIKLLSDIILIEIYNISNLNDLLLSVYISQIEAFLFQLLVVSLLFFLFGRKKITNKISIAKRPLLVLGCGILIYVIIAVVFRMKDPIDKTLLLEQNISYHLMLKMRYINFVFNLFVLPCLWIIIRKLTVEKK